MLVDTAIQVPDDYLRFDVCIVGSGPAGITVAREISRSGLRVGILECGGQKSVEEAQSLNSGAVDSPHGYRETALTEGRHRQFGGTANLWNHKSRGASGRHIRYVQLDEIDFERRDWIPESGWPFGRRALQPFYERAQEVCGIGKFVHQDEASESGTKGNKPWQTEEIESVISQLGTSKIFLEQYRRELIRDERITVILRAVLLQLQMDPLSRTITSAEACAPDGQKVPSAGTSLRDCCRRPGERAHFAAARRSPARRTGKSTRYGWALFYGSPTNQAGDADPCLQRDFWPIPVLRSTQCRRAGRDFSVACPPGGDAPREDAQSLRRAGAAFQEFTRPRPERSASAPGQSAALSLEAFFTGTSHQPPDGLGATPATPSAAARRLLFGRMLRLVEIARDGAPFR